MITKQGVEWTIALIDDAISRTTVEEKLTKLEGLKGSYTELLDAVPDVAIDAVFVNTSSQVLLELEQVSLDYSEMNMVDLQRADELKRSMIVYLEQLSTLKERAAAASLVLETYLKKELRAKLIKEMMKTQNEDGKKPSFSQCEKLVESNQTYVVIQKQVHQVVSLAALLKTKYHFYSQCLSSIVQSVSTASKEREMSRKSNAT